MKGNTLHVPADLVGITSKADRTLTLRFNTQEIPDTEKLLALQFQGSMGHLLFRENAFSDAEVPKEDIEDKSKSPSKRLRAVLYKLFMQQGGQKVDFEQWYRVKMETIIEHYKGKLDL